MVQLRPGRDPTDDDNWLTVAGDRLARYKLPKGIVRVDRVMRSPSGKADYAWAKARVAPPASG